MSVLLSLRFVLASVAATMVVAACSGTDFASSNDKIAKGKTGDATNSGSGSGGSSGSGSGSGKGSSSGSGSKGTGSGSGSGSKGSGSGGGSNGSSGSGGSGIGSDGGSGQGSGGASTDTATGGATNPDLGSIEVEDAETSVFKDCTIDTSYNPADVQCNINVAGNNVWNNVDGWREAIGRFSDKGASFISPLPSVNDGGRDLCQLLDGTEKLIYVSYVKVGAGSHAFEAIMDDVGQVRLWFRSDPNQEKYVTASPAAEDKGSATLAAGGYAVVVEARDTAKAATAMTFSMKDPGGNVVKRSVADGSWCIFRVPASTDVKTFLPQAAGCRPCFGKE